MIKVVHHFGSLGAIPCQNSPLFDVLYKAPILVLYIDESSNGTISFMDIMSLKSDPVFLSMSVITRIRKDRKVVGGSTKCYLPPISIGAGVVYVNFFYEVRFLPEGAGIYELKSEIFDLSTNMKVAEDSYEIDLEVRKDDTVKRIIQNYGNLN